MLLGIFIDDVIHYALLSDGMRIQATGFIEDPFSIGLVPYFKQVKSAALISRRRTGDNQKKIVSIHAKENLVVMRLAQLGIEPLQVLNYGDVIDHFKLRAEQRNVTRNKVKGFIMKWGEYGTTNHNKCPIPKGQVDACLAALFISNLHLGVVS